MGGMGGGAAAPKPLGSHLPQVGLCRRPRPWEPPGAVHMIWLLQHQLHRAPCWARCTSCGCARAVGCQPSPLPLPPRALAVPGLPSSGTHSLKLFISKRTLPWASLVTQYWVA